MAHRPDTSTGALNRERLRRQVFVSALAHELRQPLSALSAAVQIVRCADPTLTATAIARMERQIDQMTRVVEDLLDAARWARGKLALRKRRLDVRAVVRDAATDVQAEAEKHGQMLSVVVDAEPLWADIDPQRLHQVLSNLLYNAVKYTQPGGRISLVAAGGEGRCTLCVTDDGRGIDAAALPHIFELFSQVRPSEAAGVGLGLSIAREIVQLHEGTIEARSGGPGQGSVFLVTLPLAARP